MSKQRFGGAMALALLLVTGCTAANEEPTASRTTTSVPDKNVVLELPEIDVPANDGLDVVVSVTVTTSSPLNLQARSFLYETDAVKDIVSKYASDMTAPGISASRSDLAALIEKSLRLEDGLEDCKVRVSNVLIQNL